MINFVVLLAVIATASGAAAGISIVGLRCLFWLMAATTKGSDAPLQTLEPPDVAQHVLVREGQMPSIG